jgi:hypothetical protein
MRSRNNLVYILLLVLLFFMAREFGGLTFVGEDQKGRGLIERILR